MSSKHYLLYGSERYALAILRPLQAAIRARGHEAGWFFDGPGGEELQPGETLLPSIERALARPPDLMGAIRDYADSIHPYRDGRSSERVLDAVDQFIAAGARNLRPKPRNWWRKLKIRRRIRYWGKA
jgi:hypothetical protein